MGVLDLFRKRKQASSAGKELNIPPPPSHLQGDVESTISFDDVLPPPRGFDEEPSAPHAIEDIEVPATHEDEMEGMPQFPEFPQEDEMTDLDVPLPEEEPLAMETPEAIHDEPENLELPPLEEYHEDVPDVEEHHASVQEAQACEPDDTTFSEPAEPMHLREKRGPIFVDLPHYASVLDAIEDVKGNLRDCTGALSNAIAAKNLEDSRLDAWQSALENLQRKILYVDKSLFEKGE